MILSAGLLILSAALVQLDGESMLDGLLRDIPRSDQSDADLSQSVVEVQELLDLRATRLADVETEQGLCRTACLADAQALDSICERHVLPSASMSRAICYERVDDDRIACQRACSE